MLISLEKCSREGSILWSHETWLSLSIERWCCMTLQGSCKVQSLHYFTAQALRVRGLAVIALGLGHFNSHTVTLNDPLEAQFNHAGTQSATAPLDAATLPYCSLVFAFCVDTIRLQFPQAEPWWPQCKQKAKKQQANSSQCRTGKIRPSTSQQGHWQLLFQTQQAWEHASQKDISCKREKGLALCSNPAL